MKKLMLVALLVVLIGVPIGNALAADNSEGSEPSNFRDVGRYLYFPVAPSNFQGFDSILFISSFFNPVFLEVNTTALVNLPGSPIQQTNIDIQNPFSTVVLTPRLTSASVPTFNCPAPPANLCQVFIHPRVQQTVDPFLQNFTATLLVTNGQSFQFVAPYFFDFR